MSLSGSFDATRESPMRTSGSTIKRALTPMIIRPLAAIFGVAVALGVPNQTPAAEDAVPTLWYTQPAVKWTDALPVGRLTPAVSTTKSEPSVRLPRIWVSVRPSMSLR